MSADVGAGTRSRERHSSSGTSSLGDHQQGDRNGYRQDDGGNGRDDYFFSAPIGEGSVNSSSIRSPGKQRQGNLLSPTKRSKDRGSTRDLVRLLIAERDSKDALRALNKTTDRLQEETVRANDLEKRLAESNEKWKMVNQARLASQSEATRLSEELKLYKLQLEAAQQQITRANDMITQSDKERIAAEENAEKATRLANKLKEEQLVRQAREDGRRQGREEGRREGKRIGYHEALDYAYARARDDVMRRLDAYLLRNGLATEENLGDVEEEFEGMGPEDEQALRAQELEEDMEERRRLEPSPSNRAELSTIRADEERRPQPSSMNHAVPMPEPELPYTTRTPPDPGSGRSRRKGSILGRFLRRPRVGEEDRNVEVNRSAPDVAAFVDNAPPRTLATPVITSSPYASQPQGRRSQASFHMQMPEPDFNPGPKDKRPISNYNRPRTPSHPKVDIPPDNFIPFQGADGNMEIPPPHEMQKPPPTPGQGNTPRQELSALPSQELASRDFYYENQQQQPPPATRYQRSVAESVNSTATSNLSIIDRQPQAMSRLSVVHESSPYGERSNLREEEAGSIQRPASRNSERIVPGDDYMGATGGYQGTPNQTFAEHRTRVRDELRDTDLGRGQNPPYSPRSVRSGASFTHGPRRPSIITTPAPLGDMMIDPEGPYTRPRLNSGASDRTGFTNPRSQRAGGSAVGSGRMQGASVLEAPAPEILVEPPSRSESQRSTRMAMPQPSVVLPNPNNSSPLNPSYDGFASRDANFAYSNPLMNTPSPNPIQQAGVTTSMPMPPPPVPSTPGMPPGFIPSGMPPPPAPSTPGMPPGFIPSVMPPPPIPSTPGMPPGFIPSGVATPSSREAEPPALPSSEPFPPGFVPMSSNVSNDPLPVMPDPIIPPTPGSGSISNALPVLPSGGCSQSPRLDYYVDADAGGHGWGNGSGWDNHSQAMSPRPVSPRPPGIRPIYAGSSGTHQSSYDPALNSTLPAPAFANSGYATPIIPPQISSYGMPSPKLGAGLAQSNTVLSDSAYPRPISPAPRLPGAFDFGSDHAGFQSRGKSLGHARTGSSASGSGSGLGKPVIPASLIPSYGDTLGASGIPQRAPSPRPSVGGVTDRYGNGAVPIIPSNTPSRAGVPRTNSYGSAAGSRTQGLSRSQSMNEARSPRPGYIGLQDQRAATLSARTEPSGPVITVIPDISGLPPAPLRTPHSRRLSIDPEYVQIPPSDRNSAYTFATTPGRGREPIIPDELYPMAPASPAFSGRTGGSRARKGGRAPEFTGESPRSSRVYPRTPHVRPGGLDDPGPGEPGAPPMDRPVYGFTNRDPGLRRPSSRASMTSNKSARSYKSFDASTYVDPASLAIGA